MVVGVRGYELFSQRTKAYIYLFIFSFSYCCRVTRAASRMTTSVIFMVNQKARADALFLRSS
jgi:hypothetical protein